LGNPFLDFTEEITREWQARGFSQEQVRGSDRFCYARSFACLSQEKVAVIKKKWRSKYSLSRHYKKE